MAKKQDLNAIFRKTAPAPELAPPPPPPPGAAAEAMPDYDLSGNIRSMGVGLTTGEIDALQAIADRHQLARNALARIAVRYFLREAMAGRVRVADYVETETKTTRRPRLP